MKLSKGVSLLMGLVLASGLGFLLTVGVLAENSKQLKLDPANRQQHIQVKLIQDSDSYRNYYANLGKIGESLTHITLYNGSNFVMDSNTSSSDGNFIDNNSSKSNILGGSGNKIQGARYATILGGYRNINSGGSNSTILGGRNNVITGDYNTVLGGENNAVYEGSGSSVAGGSGNVIFGDYSATIGNYNSVHGDYSLALGRNSKLRASNSFLWTDGSHPSEMLRNNNLFVVNSRSGMVVNASGAHSFAQLTIGGPLIVYDSWKDPQQCNSELKGVMKVVEGDNGQKCFCSCDGTGWNSMYGLGRCEGKCNPDLAPKCGNEITRQTSPTDGKFYYRGTCEVGYPVDGTGAYFVDKYSGIHWSCQTDDGQVVRCPDGEIIEPEDILCPEGEVYDETDGKCKKACVMTAGFGSITVMDKDGYAITVADRNLGATSTDVNDLTSFGCFYQWGNNCGFQPVGDITISTEKVNVSGVEPSSYKNCEYVVSPSCANNSRECTDSDWAQNPNHNLWGGGNDSSSNAFGVLDTDKVKRKGPCPEGWHVPGQGEWSDLLTIWYNKEYSQNLQYVKDTHKIQAFKDNENLVSKFRNKFYLAPAGSRSNIDATPDGMYQIGGSYWASSSPWKIGSLSSQSLIGDSRIGRFPNEAYSFDYSETYIGNGIRGVKNSGQSVRCFKDVPDCPLGSTWNPVTLKCECNNGGNIANDCGISQCTGSIPANATGNNTRVPTVTTGWYFSTNLTAACTYRCNSGYVYSGGLCESGSGSYACYGTVPSHATLVSGSNLNLTGNVKNELYKSMLDVGDNRCAYLCQEEYEYTRAGCVKSAEAKCTNVYDNRVVVGGSDKSLTKNTTGTLYPTETLAMDEVQKGKKCAYVCDEAKGYNYICVDGVCSCAVCEDGTYDSETYTCVVSKQTTCNGKPAHMLLPSRIYPGELACLAIGNCIYGDEFLKSIPTDGQQYEYTLAQPIGIGDTEWSCVSGTPSEHMCQYQCKPGMVCDGGKCVAGPTTQSAECGGSIPEHATQRSSTTTYTKTWNGSTWTPASKNWREFWSTPSSEGNECLFVCNTNYGWNGTSCVLNKETAECGGNIPANATQRSSTTTYTKTLNFKTNVWEPESKNWREFWSTPSSEGDECLFMCETDYRWNSTTQECEKRSCDSTTLPSGITTTNADIYSNPTESDQEYVYNEQANSQDNGCYYKCKESYEGVKSNGKVVICKKKNSCVNLPDGAVVVSENATGVNQYYLYSGGATSSTIGCYYKCDTANGYVWNSSTQKCEKNKCGSLPDGAVAVSNNPTSQNERYKYDSEGTKDSGSRGCYYRCDSNYTWNPTTQKCDENNSCVNLPKGAVPVSSKPTQPNQPYQYDSDGNKNSNSQGCYYRCDTNYTYNSTRCEADTRSQNCSTFSIANATPTVSTFTQTWTEDGWYPSSQPWTHNGSECGYVCNEHYQYKSKSCQLATQKKNCPSFNIPNATKKSGHKQFTQTWDLQRGAFWPDTMPWTYDGAECGFLCDSDYEWDSSEGECKEKKYCADLPSGVKPDYIVKIPNAISSNQKYIYDKNATQESQGCYYYCKDGYVHHIKNGVDLCRDPDRASLCKDVGCKDDYGNDCTWKNYLNGCGPNELPPEVTSCPSMFQKETNSEGDEDCVLCIPGTQWSKGTKRCENI